MVVEVVVGLAHTFANALFVLHRDHQISNVDTTRNTTSKRESERERERLKSKRESERERERERETEE
jgi:hypothetical protein